MILKDTINYEISLKKGKSTLNFVFTQVAVNDTLEQTISKWLNLQVKKRVVNTF